MIYGRIILIITILFSFLNGFVLPFTGKVYPVMLVILGIFFLYILIFHSKFIIKKLVFLYKKTSFKYLFYFLIYLFFQSLFLITISKSSIFIYYRIFIKWLPSLLFYYLVSALFIPELLSIKKTIKIFYFILFAILCWGILQFIGEIFNIEIIQICVNTISNWKYVAQGVEGMTDNISGSVRIRSVFHEPGAFANFIFFMLPFVYKFSLSKYKIYDNKYINIIIKYSLIPLSWICLLLTMSPIFLIFASVFTLLYFYKNIIKFILKYIYTFILFLFISLLCLCIFISHAEQINNIIQQTYLARISNVLASINNFEALIFIEPSLSSRIVYFVNQIELFTKHPIVGYGFDNARYFMYEQYLHSPLPLTPEIKQTMIDAITTKAGCALVKTLLSGLLVETGIIGTFLYFIFLYKNIKFLKVLKKYFNGIEQNFISSMNYCFISAIVVSFYQNSSVATYMSLLYGLVCSYICIYYKLRKNYLKDKGEIKCKIQ